MDLRPLFQPYLKAGRPSPKGSSRGARVPNVSVLSQKNLVFHLLNSNPRLQWLRHSQKVYWARVNSFAIVSNPELRVMGLSGALANGDTSRLGVRLRWSPPFPTVHAARQDRARAEAMIQEQQIWIETYQLLRSARHLYVWMLANNAQIKTTKKWVQRSLKAWRWEKSRLKLEGSTVLQVSSARLAYLQAKAALHRLRAERVARKSALKKLLGVQGRCDIVGELKVSSEAPLLKKLIKQALQRSPLLAVLRNRYRAHHAALWIEKTKRIPWLSFVQLSYDWGQVNWPLGLFLGVGINLPVFSWNTGRIRQEEVQIKAIRAQAKAQVARVVTAVRAAYLQWKQLAQAVQAHHPMFQKNVAQIELLVQKVRSLPASSPEQILRLEEQVSRLRLQQTEQVLRLQYARISLDEVASTPVWSSLGVQPPRVKRMKAGETH